MPFWDDLTIKTSNDCMLHLLYTNKMTKIRLLFSLTDTELLLFNEVIWTHLLKIVTFYIISSFPSTIFFLILKGLCLFCFFYDSNLNFHLPFAGFQLLLTYALLFSSGNLESSSFISKSVFSVVSIIYFSLTVCMCLAILGLLMNLRTSEWIHWIFLRE